jgi:acetylornithine deacetylase/succinyl-diaminopimelate desuccinylase-like protein
MLNSLWDERGNALVTEERALSQGTDSDTGPTEARFRRDAGVLDGVDLMGDGELTDRIWLRPAITVLGIDCPSVVGSLPAIPATVRARISVRIPPGMSGQEAENGLINRLREVAPWNAVVEIETQAVSEPFSRRADGPAFSTLRESLRDAYKREPTEVGQGGAIPVCGAFSDAYPDAEILLFGVEEPQCAIHSQNESVNPSEIERIALAECLFLSRYSHAQTDE